MAMPSPSVPGGCPTQAVKPLLNWDLSPASIPQVVNAVASAAPLLQLKEEDGWVAPFCLLACDYLRSIAPGLDTTLTAQVTTAVGLLTKTLLDRMGDLQMISSTGEIACATDYASGILAMAGGQPLNMSDRERHQAALASKALPDAFAAEEGNGALSGSQGLPQTDITKGLLQSLSSQVSPSLPSMVASLRPGPSLLSFLGKLPRLAGFCSSWQSLAANKKTLAPPVLNLDDVSILTAEVALASKLLALPVFGPVGLEQAGQVSSLALGSLMAALALMPGLSASPDTTLVNDALQMTDSVTSMLRASTRLGAATVMNFTMCVGYVLVQGLLPLTPTSTAITSMNPSLALLTERLLTCVELLTDDISPEEALSPGAKAELGLSGSYSGVARCALVLVPSLPQLLLRLAALSFTQARLTIAPRKEEAPNPVPPANLAIDDADEEPLLGHWMTSLLAPGPICLLSALKGDDKREENSAGGETAAKETPACSSNLDLSASLLTFLSNALSSSCPFVQPYVQASLNQELVTGLANLILAASEEPLPSTLPAWPKFSLALSTFTTSMISAPLSSSLASALLEGLHLSPTSTKPWPLAASRRALSVLAQVLLTRQASEEAHSTSVTSQYVAIWQRAVDAMAAAARAPAPQEDVSVTTIHLLLLLFHSLQLMQKKTVLVAVSRALTITCVEAPKRPEGHYCLHLARLALLQDYLVRHLYEPPASLLPLIRSNLFSRSTLCSPASSPITPELDSGDPSSAPFFLILAPPPGLQGPEVPRLDGLALSFLLSTPEHVDYPGLHSSLLSSIYPLLTSGAGKPALYCFLAVWRLVQALPPPAPLLRQLVAEASLPHGEEGQGSPEFGLALQTLVLGPKATHRTFANWVRDCLTKQGVPLEEGEALVNGLATRVTSCRAMVALMLSYLSNLERGGEGGLKAAHLALLDCMMARIHVSIDRQLGTATSTGDSPETGMELAHSLVPAVARLVTQLAAMARAQVMETYSTSLEGGKLEPTTRASLLHCLCLAGTRCSVTASLALPLTAHLPPSLRKCLEEWSASSLASFPPASAWRSTESSGDSSTMPATLAAHTTFLSSHADSIPPSALKHCLFSATRFACDLLLWCPDNSPQQRRLVAALFPLLLDATTENMADLATLSLERVVGTGETAEFLAAIQQLVLQHSYPILVARTIAEPSILSPHIPQEILRYLDTLLDRPASRSALASFFVASPSPGPRLTELLLSLACPPGQQAPEYAQRVLRFFSKLFSVSSQQGEDSVAALCGHLSSLTEVATPRLESWLRYLVIGMFQGGDGVDEDTLQENRLLLQSLTTSIVGPGSGVPESVPLSILSLLTSLASELLSPLPSLPTVGFPDLVMVMGSLAMAGGGRGHLTLLPAAIQWLATVKQILTQGKVVSLLEQGVTGGRHSAMLDNASTLLTYILDLVVALKYGSGRWCLPTSSRPSSPGPDDKEGDDCASWTEDGLDDDDSAGEESDDEGMDSKLCTYTQTARVFMNQHWYHCHTCGMVEGVGCCSICARVCHRDCDVTYSKHGSFFCDCGAREDGSCGALTVRNSSAGVDGQRRAPLTYSVDSQQLSSSPRKEEREEREPISAHQLELARQIDGVRGALQELVTSSSLLPSLLDLCKALAPVLESGARVSAPLGAMARLRSALNLLHSAPASTCEMSDQLVLPTLGSQEGAFENVKMNFTGEQGQTIRQLLNAHMIRRGIMCCLSSPGGKRQHLAVAHEKGKITVLQLSALLKQADSSQKKLTLTRLASAPVPFTVLSLVSNPTNENLLAVCGLKDCHVLTFNSSGGVQEQLVLQPQLEAANYIIKPVWLPGSQTQLAVVTADSVKIYELSEDALSPAYYFLVPSGKIRDVTFVHAKDGSIFLILMSSAGHVYFQQLCDESSARHGSFYVTNIMEVGHPEVRDAGGSLAGGGVSIYYSHTLQMLFFSYAQGKAFMAPLADVTEELATVFQISVRSAAAVGGTSKPGPQVVTGWGEVPGHPGLITAVLQQVGNPLILMVEPEKNTVQEIKVGTKAKIMDMVAIRHVASGSTEEKTTLILLCEDGSLKIYMASADATGYWLQPSLQPTGVLDVARPTSRRKRAAKVLRSTGHVAFPLDFFEHCQQQTNDIEFGGTDVLQVYNVGQVKQRLQTSGLYVANTRPGGFTLEVANTDSSNVLVGLRVLLGTQDITRVPSTLEVFGRTTHVTLTRPRWIELPFTREESIQANNKVLLNFGASQDPGGVNMVDSVQLWTKTKENFGWPEDTEDFSIPQGSGELEDERPASATNTTCLTPVDRVVVSALRALDVTLVVTETRRLEPHVLASALEVATRLLVAPGPNEVQSATRSVLAALHPTRASCHAHTDSALLRHATAVLRNPGQLDVEEFHHLVATARAIAVARPTNLVRFAESQGEARGRNEECQRFMELLAVAFWRLLDEIPANCSSGCLGQPGLTHVETTVQWLVDIINAVARENLDTAGCAASHYIKLLLCPDQRVAFPARAALVRALRPRPRRRRMLPQPPSSASVWPGTGREDTHQSRETSREARASTPGEARPAAPAPPPLPAARVPRPPGLEEAAALALGPGGIQLGGVAGNLEALLPRGNIPAMIDLPADVDDETMVELAIALSLQDQGEGGVLQQGLQGLQQLANLGQGLAGILGGQAEQEEDSEEGEEEERGEVENNQVGRAGQEDGGGHSDTTASAPASAPASDDEGSLGGIPEGEGVESEGDSIGVESHGAVSGRSSTPSGAVEEAREEREDYRVAGLRQVLLERLVAGMGQLREVGGARCIPYMQLVLALATDLEQGEGRERAALDSLLSRLIQELVIPAPTSPPLHQRTPARELQLVVLRLLSVLMSRPRPSTPPRASETVTWVGRSTASALSQAATIAHSLEKVQALLSYWQGLPLEEGTAVGVLTGSRLLRPASPRPPPDMAPFFLKQYVKSHSTDVFEAYPQLLTEMALRIPYQMRKIAESGQEPVPHFDQAWFYQLCELMMTPQAPFVKRQVRKLLLLICGTKEQYRQLRDMHTLETRIREVRATVAKGGFDPLASGSAIQLQYDSMIQLIEQLKTCVEVAEGRTLNWQRFCISDESVLPFLLQVSYLLDAGVSPLVLQLLQGALCPTAREGSRDKPSRSKSSSPVKAVRKEKGRSEEPDDEGGAGNGQCAGDLQLSAALVRHISVSSQSVVARFCEKFLLEANSQATRWQAHALLYTIYTSSAPPERRHLVAVMWDLWTRLPEHGRRAAQFVDLLGYFTVEECRSNPANQGKYAEAVCSMLKRQNRILSRHANSAIYYSLSQLCDFTGYYLESDPCLVCNNPEVSFNNLKLSSLKVDTKYSTSSQMVKLSGSHSISKILLRIGDLKRQKMVRHLNIFYNNRTVGAVVELKNRPTMWHLAKRVTLTAGQTDLKLEFPLPIVACNIMIEYSDFYENMVGVGESLQCPRCSATVPANPGVCSNCGENVFQCHKCRAINYDEKDPFLCNSCGFCKYAKFEYSLTARPCCAVDPVETEDDRKKAVASINSLLEKADKVYRTLIGNKPELESLLAKVSDGSDVLESSASSNGSPVNRWIHQLGQKYCIECKNSFEELSKLIQRVMATRLELLQYDKSVASGSGDLGAATPQVERKLSSGVGGLRVGGGAGACYGCATACVEHCLTLLRAIATRQAARADLHSLGLVEELLEHNLKQGAAATRSSVQALICLLTRNNPEATVQLNQLLFSRLSSALAGGPQLIAPIRHEVTLLASLLQQRDNCWETRLRTVVKLFLIAAKHHGSPAIMEAVTLPCLNMLQALLNTDKSNGGAVLRPPVDIQAWLREEVTYLNWSTQHSLLNSPAPIGRFFAKWRSAVTEKKWSRAYGGLAVIHDTSYLKQILFNRSCTSGRAVTATMVQHFIDHGPQRRKREMIDSLTSMLGEVGAAGEASEQFMELYKGLVSHGDWRYYLAVKGVLPILARLITQEIEVLGSLEQTRLSSDLALGYAVKQLTSLMASLLQYDKIRAVYKGRLVSGVLGGYLSLRRLVVQRTKMIDDTQDRLLDLLEDLTTGTEEETRAFMAVCIDTVGKYPATDQLTPTFIFERLCSIIFPEEAETGEFFLSLEKDPQQEEFLQGRMLGNPYSSKEAGMGPLMREVKNKICTDCELVALLEDDNGMELLVNNRIISLDLPVKEVYQKVWLAEAGEGEPMRVVYRMRGLLGDATEEFLERLDKRGEGEASDDEVTYRLARVLGECGGLSVILDKLSSITSLGNKTLMSVLLRLLGYCCKLHYCRTLLLSPSLRATPVLLGALQLCLQAGENGGLTDTVLQLMERLLVEAAASHQSLDQYQAFAGPASVKDIGSLLDHAVHIKPGTELHHHLMRVLPFLTYANRDNMELVINHFASVLDFDAFDASHSAEDEARLEAWVAMCEGIERNRLGNTMKDELVRLGIVSRCTDYIKQNAPPTKQVLLRTDDLAWKEFAMKPSLKFLLRGLAGLAASHPATQTALAASIISQLHLMEQMSSEEHLGSLAEAVLEALRSHPEAGARVEEVRTGTREEKKKMAMAMRAKQLKAIGLKTNDKGQVKAESSLLEQFQAIAEESGLACVICREGYRFQPTKVLAIYTFTRRAPLEEAERSVRKTIGFSTVSHFNLVHVDCHLAAVRQARARDEWESALLQNANTKCNGLLPLWGPGITESAYAACLARHNTYLAEATGQRDISYQATAHDIKLLLLKFAQERSFSVESGGGGPQSNMHLLPYLAHMGLYVINTTRAGPREIAALQTWLRAPAQQWAEQAVASDGPLYSTTLCLLLLSPQEWASSRLSILQRLIATGHVRAAQGGPISRNALDFNAYKQLVLFWALVDLLIREMWAGVPLLPDQDWSSSLAEWLRTNDETIIARSVKVLTAFQEDLVPAQDLLEVMDVCEILGEVPSPATVILEAIQQLP